MFTIYMDGQVVKYKSFVFSGGEVHVQLPFDERKCTTLGIYAYIKDSKDIMELLMLKDAIDRSVLYKYCVLEIPYLPYARQDRVCNKGEALGVKVMANLINSMKFDEVYVDDCHSDVGVAVIDNCKNHSVERLLMLSACDFGLGDPNLVLVSPDAGANKKTYAVAQRFDGIPVIRADKVRDVKTGNITGTTVYADDLSGKTCFIIDDICDGGRTFVELAKVLKAKGASKVSLYVTHGIFSKGFDELLASGVDTIYTSYKWCEEENLNVIEI